MPYEEYIPTKWEDGDVITAERMNHLEQGVVNQRVGPPGKDGTDGADGRDGIDGKDGAQGPQGIPGLNSNPITIHTVTIPASSWTEDRASVALESVLADELKQLISPTPASGYREAYYEAGVQCVSQAEGGLTFSCVNQPEIDLTVYVLIQEIST